MSRLALRPRPYPLAAPRLHPIAVALVCGALAFVVSYRTLVSSGMGAWDLSWALRGAELLRQGGDPYQADLFRGSRLYDAHPAFRSDPLYYPLPAVLLVLPLSLLPYEVAGALFAGVSTALLAYAVRRHAPHLWPLLLSANLYISVFAATWLPLVLAASLLPALSPLLVVKPSIGGALWLSRPSRRAAFGGACLLAASLLIRPTWPLGWLHNLQQTHHPIPLAVLPFGPLLALALLRWRTVEGRRFALLTCVPQILSGGDQLALFLCLSTRNQAAALAAWSWVVYGAGQIGLLTAQDMGSPDLVLLLHLPVLCGVLLGRRADEVNGGRAYRCACSAIAERNARVCNRCREGERRERMPAPWRGRITEPPADGV